MLELNRVHSCYGKAIVACCSRREYLVPPGLGFGHSRQFIDVDTLSLSGYSQTDLSDSPVTVRLAILRVSPLTFPDHVSEDEFYVGRDAGFRLPS
jgi:hypothetical protein